MHLLENYKGHDMIQILLRNRSYCFLNKAFIIVFLLVFSGCSPALVKSYRDDVDYKNKLLYALPKGMIDLKYGPSATQAAKSPSDQTKSGDSGSGSKATEQRQLSVGTIIIPDPKHYYLLENCNNISFDDEVDIQIDNLGLLKSINTKTKSQIPSILLEVTEIAKSALKLTTKLAGSKNYELTIDPAELALFDTKTKNKYLELPELTSRIKDLDSKYRGGDKSVKAELDKLKLRQLKINSEIPPELLNKVNKYEKYNISEIFLVCDAQFKPQTDHDEFPGFYYRPMLPYELFIKTTEEEIIDTIIYLPNFSPLMKFAITRPAFVEKITNLTFDKGVLTGIHINKPSELLAGLKIPSDILKSVAGLPLELLQFRVNYDQEYNNLLKAQIQEIQNKQQLMQLQLQGK
jgi:hypothetical protein